MRYFLDEKGVEGRYTMTIVSSSKEEKTRGARSELIEFNDLDTFTRL